MNARLLQMAPPLTAAQEEGPETIQGVMESFSYWESVKNIEKLQLV